MQNRTPVFIVTSARPRVGKTLIARALIEYFQAQKRPVAAFDINPGEAKLIDHLPSCTTLATIDDTWGEVALFDRLASGDELPKIVDLGHMVFERFFPLVDRIDFLVEAERQGVAPMVLFVADADPRSRKAYAALRTRFPTLALVPVFNAAAPGMGLIDQHASFPPTRRGGETLTVPALSPVVRSVVDRASFSFVGYASKAVDTTSELFDWMRKVFLGFHELEVRLLLGELAPQLRQSA